MDPEETTGIDAEKYNSHTYASLSRNRIEGGVSLHVFAFEYILQQLMVLRIYNHIDVGALGVLAQKKSKRGVWIIAVMPSEVSYYAYWLSKLMDRSWQSHLPCEIDDYDLEIMHRKIFRPVHIETRKQLEEYIQKGKKMERGDTEAMQTTMMQTFLDKKKTKKPNYWTFFFVAIDQFGGTDINIINVHNLFRHNMYTKKRVIYDSDVFRVHLPKFCKIMDIIHKITIGRGQCECCCLADAECVCMACFRAKYCSHKCQALHWETHMGLCDAIVAAGQQGPKRVMSN